METLMDVEQGLLYGPMWLGGFHWTHHLQKGAWHDGNAQMRLHVSMAQGGGKVVHCTLHSVLPWADGLGMILEALTFFFIMWIQRSPPVFASFGKPPGTSRDIYLEQRLDRWWLMDHVDFLWLMDHDPAFLWMHHLKILIKVLQGTSEKNAPHTGISEINCGVNLWHMILEL